MSRSRGALRAVEPAAPELDPVESEVVDYFARLELVRRVPPIDRAPYCRACYQRGCIAAVRAFDGHDDILLRVLELRESPVPDRAPHSGACYRRGVDAVLDAIELGVE